MPKSLQQVLSQIDKLQKEAEDIRAREVAGVIGRIQEAIKHYSLTPEDLFGAALRKNSTTSKGKRGGIAKYQAADGRTWSGVGKRPSWFVEALASGKKPEDLLITTSKGTDSKAKTARSTANKSNAKAQGKRAGEPKYHNGEGKTWTGKGTRPGWFVAALEAGKTAEDLLIHKA